MVGIKNKTGRLCGELKGTFRYYDEENKRQSTKSFDWISSNLITRRNANSPTA